MKRNGKKNVWVGYVSDKVKHPLFVWSSNGIDNNFLSPPIFPIFQHKYFHKDIKKIRITVEEL